MIGATLAIGDFMLLLAWAVAGAAAGLIGWLVLAIGAAGGIALSMRWLLHRR